MNLKILIEEGLQDLETGKVISGKKAFQKLRLALTEHLAGLAGFDRRYMGPLLSHIQK
ncbi:hypothetical protein [Teredinibacter turnerae]|uniref:hypothetical protein n=1 Tax=Teredinibacter turnerae TaxID=2426 RepID=UPI00037470F5|nr:hypothetical protein [Teredinibacter turnerae]